jgi:hypothetical protein
MVRVAVAAADVTVVPTTVLVFSMKFTGFFS